MLCNPLLQYVDEKTFDVYIKLWLSQWSGQNLDVFYHLIYMQLAYYGRYDLFKHFYYQVGAVWDAYIMASAADNEHFEIVKFLVKNQCPRFLGTFLDISKPPSNENLDALNYLVKEGFAVGPRVCMYYAQLGDLKHLKRASKNKGSVWDGRTRYYAGFYGNKKCFDYAKEAGCENYEEYLSNLRMKYPYNYLYLSDWI